MDNSAKTPAHIRIPRSLLSHPTVRGMTDIQFRMLIYILENAAFSKVSLDDHGKTVELEPGQFMFTYRDLASEFGTSKGNIQRFLARLKAGKISVHKPVHTKTILTFTHSDTCELFKSQAGTRIGTSWVQDEYLKEEGKKIRNKNTNVFYAPNSCEFVLANFFLDSIKKINPDAKTPDLQKWSDDFRKMLNLDKRTEDQIRAMIAWMERPGFDNNRFRKKILSPALLRKNWDAMVMCLNIIPIKQIVNAPKITHNRPVHEEYNDYF